jgi:hypothetical protein
MVVVVNAANEVAQLERYQVVDIFMGRTAAFPNGEIALPLDLKVDSRERERFYTSLTGRTAAQVNAYWARLIFSGRASPPRVMHSVAAILDAIRKNRGAIAYLDSQQVDSTVKVIYRLE